MSMNVNETSEKTVQKKRSHEPRVVDVSKHLRPGDLEFLGLRDTASFRWAVRAASASAWLRAEKRPDPRPQALQRRLPRGMNLWHWLT